MNDSSSTKIQPSLHKAVGRALALVFVDAFFFNQGAISALVGVGLVLIGLPLAILRRPYSARAARLRNLGVYALAIIIVFALNAANNRLAHYRAEALISAIKSFHQKYHRYPEKLDNLVPEFIEYVPVAKYTLFLNNFSYYADDGKAILYYVSLPPFSRPTYNFSKDEWSYLD